ncbi:MAG: LemA family protein [Deltaproteobacteria bacterium]|nr:LemA family protein [Deltaproteobacteria bacterium]
MFFTYGLLVLLLIVFAWWFMTFNSLVALRNSIDQAWSNIEVELKRRVDLISNMVEVVKGYASHEKSTFEEVTSLRNRRISTAAEGRDAEQQMNQATLRLFALAEDYPALKADSHFADLQRELINTEDRIAERRNAYNQTVTLYQNMRLTLPSNMVAGVHNFKERAFFDAPDEIVNQVPKLGLL